MYRFHAVFRLSSHQTLHPWIQSIELHSLDSLAEQNAYDQKRPPRPIQYCIGFSYAILPIIFNIFIMNATFITQEQFAELKSNVDNFFVLIISCLIYFMQCGFAFLECGAVRIRNATNILFKNAMDSFVGALSYWSIGYGLGYGKSLKGFMGTDKFFAIDLPASDYSSVLFQFSFAATAATIVSGAVAERMQMTAYLLISIVLTGVVYPIVTHWGWAGGWLAENGFQDFAGSGIVHLCGGSCALVAAILLGPRFGRFEKHSDDTFRGHSVPHIALGAFILFFGFLAFNGGSVGAITTADDGTRNDHICARAMLNTILCGSCGALTTLILRRQLAVSLAVNGALAGMVGACGGCNVYPLWAAPIVGITAGLVYNLFSWTLQKLHIDDPLDAFPVHGGGGMVGIMMVPIFDKDQGLIASDTSNVGKMFAWQSIGLGVIFIWSVLWSVLMFGFFRCFNLLRVKEEIEIVGMDEIKHKEFAYPDVYDGAKQSENGGIFTASRNSVEPLVIDVETTQVRQRVRRKANRDPIDDVPHPWSYEAERSRMQGDGERRRRPRQRSISHY